VHSSRLGSHALVTRVSNSHEQTPLAQIPPPKRLRRRIAVGLLVLFSVAGGGLFVAVRRLALPDATGRFSLGQTSFNWTDRSRHEIWAEDDRETRDLMVYFWYPAAVDPAALDHPGASAPYFPEFKMLADNLPLGKGLGLRVVTSALGSHAHFGAPMINDQTPHPILLFSPGGGNPVRFYSFLLEELASHGYVVVGVEPTYDGLGQIFPNGRVTHNLVERQRPGAGGMSEGQQPQEDYRAFYRRRVEQRAADLRFTLDQLAKLNDGVLADTFRGRLDLKEIGVLGHSIGGIAAVEVARTDPRIRAVINLDGAFEALPFLADKSAAPLRQPLLWIRHALSREPPQRSQNALAQLAPESYEVVLAECHHTDFSDEPFFYPEFRSAVEEAQRHRTQVIRGGCVGFLDQILRHRRATFFDTRQDSDPGVSITRLRTR
jgi:pimeloyl-ACP methyl ester carboxylesterase